MSSNSATPLATQQSIKAYVDANAGGSSFTAAGISGSFTSLSASIATDINNAGGSVDLTRVDSVLAPDADNTRDLGYSNREWRNLYLDGTAYIDAINMPHEGKIDFGGGDGIIEANGNNHQIYLERAASGGQSPPALRAQGRARLASRECCG